MDIVDEIIVRYGFARIWRIDLLKEIEESN